VTNWVWSSSHQGATIGGKGQKKTPLPLITAPPPTAGNSPVPSSSPPAAVPSSSPSAAVPSRSAQRFSYAPAWAPCPSTSSRATPQPSCLTLPAPPRRARPTPQPRHRGTWRARTWSCHCYSRGTTWCTWSGTVRRQSGSGCGARCPRQPENWIRIDGNKLRFPARKAREEKVLFWCLYSRQLESKV